MKKSLTEALKKLKKDKKAFLSVVLGIAGMLLVLASDLNFSESTKKGENEINSNVYYQNLEESTERLISQINGAGKVSVMLTYESSQEYVWAKDKEASDNSEGKSDVEEKHIIIDAGQNETGLEIKVIYPRVRGVAVVCTGGADPVVKSEIKELVSALFDIGSNRISIARRAD